MANFGDNDFDYLVEEYEMGDFHDMEEESRTPRHQSDIDYNSEEEDDVNNKDTTAIQAKKGKDIQGIPWDRLNYSRDKYRETRIQNYKNYSNLLRPSSQLEKDCKHSEKGSTFYGFRHNTRSVKATIVHFQVFYHFPLTGLHPYPANVMLRNLVWSTSNHDAYLMQNYSVMHWSSVTKKATEVLNVAGHIAPAEKQPGSAAQGVNHVQVSTMAVKDRLMVAGGFQGELICKYLDKPGVTYCAKITHDDNAITNAVEIYNDASGATRIVAANNDSNVRILDTERFRTLYSFSFPWSVNHTSVGPDGKLMAVLGDSEDSLLVDSKTGKTMGTLKGHLDYSFSSAWHPNGHLLATGNQDTTCRLWDTRNLSSSLEILKGRMGAIRSIRFSSDGQFMAMAEPADFVHVYDTKNNFESSQEIDLFGEIAGISFSPDTEALFVGVADRTYGSLLEFTRQRNNYYLDALY